MLRRKSFFEHIFNRMEEGNVAQPLVIGSTHGIRLRCIASKYAYNSMGLRKNATIKDIKQVFTVRNCTTLRARIEQGKDGVKPTCIINTACLERGMLTPTGKAKSSENILFRPRGNCIYGYMHRYAGYTADLTLRRFKPLSQANIHSLSSLCKR